MIPWSDPSPEAPSILLVDDDRHALLFLKSRLAFLGVRLDTAMDGVAALGVLATRQPDLILSDAVMPRMDGFEFCRKVKADPLLRAIPFALLTSLKQNIRERAQEAGADDYLSKQESDLIFRIRTRLLLALGLRRERQGPGWAIPRRASVLVVSSAHPIQTQLEIHLAKEGLAVRAVASAEEALARLQAEGADLLILDLEQDSEALEGLIDNLRVHPTLADLPILALASKEEESSLAILEHEVQDRLLKPLDGLEIRHRVKLLLQLAGASAKI